MSVLLTRGTRLSQPQGPVEVDWANPIARGLQIAAVPIGGGYKDLARNLAWTQVNGPTVDVTNKGRALKTVSGSSQYGYFPCDVKNAPLTILHTSTLDSSSISAVFSLGTAAGTERLVLFYGATAGQYTISPIPNAGGSDTSFTTGIGDSHTSVLVLSADATPADLYLNGSKGSTGGNYWVPTGAITRFYLSARVNSTAGIFSSQRSNLSLVWSRALSDAEIASISANPWQLFKPVQRRVWFDGGAAAGGGITLTPPLLTSSNTLYAPTLTPGAVSVAPPLLTNSSTLHAPTVSVGGTVVQPPLLANSNDLFAPTLTPGAISVAPPLLPSSNAFFAPTVSVGGTVLQPPLLENTSTPYAPSVGVGAIALGPPLLTNGNTLYAPTVAATGPQTLEPPLLANASTLFAPTVGGVLPLSDAEMRNMYEMVQSIYAAVVTNAPLDVNLVRVRGQTIGGTGSASDPWGPT